MTEDLQSGRSYQAQGPGAKRWLSLLLAVVVMAAVFFYLNQPTPYYVTRPGSAIELRPIVAVEGGNKSKEAGTFMLTTVRMGEANRLWYWYAKMSPDVELMEKELVVQKGETDEDYTRRELAVMDNSQKIAEAVAFRLAGYEVKIEKRGVVVMGTIAGMPAKNVLQVGDVITAVDQQKITDANDMLKSLAGKKAGDVVQLTFLRDDKPQQATLKLAPLPGEPTRAGIGIQQDNDQLIEVPKQVTISADGIGGPSAGLMFTLEIYNQLLQDQDLTKGYRIAGTGTISADGTVGRIGGINHKVVAADAADAEIFFAPDDSQGEPSNYAEAVQTAKRIGTHMKIVPVKTVDDAIAFLKTLPPKR
ncbi:SepM family pheromone-processing serine protease [Brevibacillus fulvus]|uniref:endopeptidase La n=1 Tax=Brevibacillus fulvus TaxID=1125967 RepID=A0A938XX21_9BACL|nr:SepM family pheromone-processing serine protease [Brevibacillus fulvus]MBM7589466.1 PDZ domain-containing protein [Brevibacillus fulvus]